MTDVFAGKYHHSLYQEKRRSISKGILISKRTARAYTHTYIYIQIHTHKLRAVD